MLATKRQRDIVVWKPRSFVGLMSLYESNYLRLRRLLGGSLPAPGERLASRASGDPELWLEGIDHSRYTATLRLTYVFDDGTDPDLVIRLYHDAHLVEAMHCGAPGRHPVLAGFRTGSGTELERRWARNLMLHKWLAHCHERGHCFGPVRRRLEEPAHAGLR